MPDFMRLVATLSEHMRAELSRSDVLRALIWPFGILLLALTSGNYLRAPAWLMILFASLLVLLFLQYLFAYTFCLFKDRDALRSEKYHLQKMAIEHGLIGDDTTGLIKISAPSGEDDSNIRTIDVGKSE